MENQKNWIASLRSQRHLPSRQSQSSLVPSSWFLNSPYSSYYKTHCNSGFCLVLTPDSKILQGMKNKPSTPSKFICGTRLVCLMLLPPGPDMVHKFVVAQDLGFNADGIALRPAQVSPLPGVQPRLAHGLQGIATSPPSQRCIIT